MNAQVSKKESHGHELSRSFVIRKGKNMSLASRLFVPLSITGLRFLFLKISISSIWEIIRSNVYHFYEIASENISPCEWKKVSIEIVGRSVPWNFSFYCQSWCIRSITSFRTLPYFFRNPLWNTMHIFIWVCAHTFMVRSSAHLSMDFRITFAFKATTTGVIPCTPPAQTCNSHHTCFFSCISGFTSQILHVNFPCVPSNCDVIPREISRKHFFTDCLALR